MTMEFAMAGEDRGKARMAREGATTAGAGSSSKDAAELLNKNEAYLAELLSYSLDRLNKEPELLRDDQSRIQRQLEETAFRNYKAFVSTAECIQKVRAGAGADSLLPRRAEHRLARRPPPSGRTDRLTAARPSFLFASSPPLPLPLPSFPFALRSPCPAPPSPLGEKNEKGGGRVV